MANSASSETILSDSVMRLPEPPELSPSYQGRAVLSIRRMTQARNKTGIAGTYSLWRIDAVAFAAWRRCPAFALEISSETSLRMSNDRGSPLIEFVEGQDFRVRQGPPKQLKARVFLFIQP